MGQALNRAADGHLGLITATGHLALGGYVDCNCENMLELASCYGIDGYNDGDLTACTGCDNSSLPAWDGTWKRQPPGLFSCPDNDFNRCQWSTSINSFRINGKKKHGGVNRGVFYLEGDCYWRVHINCISGTIWTGAKSVLSTMYTPEGTYNRTSGCDTTPSLVIVAC